MFQLLGDSIFIDLTQKYVGLIKPIEGEALCEYALSTRKA